MAEETMYIFLEQFVRLSSIDYPSKHFFKLVY